MAFASLKTEPARHSLLLRCCWIVGTALVAGACRPAAPTSGVELQVMAPATAESSSEHAAEAIRTRLELAGWPWFTVEPSGPSGATVRVGDLDAERRAALTRLLTVPLRLEAFVSDRPPTGPTARPEGEPTFTSDEVEHVHLEAPRSGTRVHLRLGGPAARRVEELTRERKGGSLMVFVDGEWLMAAAISEPLRGGLVRLKLPGETAEARHLSSMELVVALRGPLTPGTSIINETAWPKEGS